TAIEGSLAALKANLVITTLASTLSLDAAAAGLALTRGGTTPHAQARALGSKARFECVKSHVVGPKVPAYACFSTFNRCTAALIIPRFSGVSATVTLWRIRRRPRPRADAAMLAS